ncbi:Spc7-domain-containing protein [Trichocladium antarcticum]|uniref:Spc7-domain-containing protein n=1 Tax=Trichocladium antarcticum TaxID=1450529 RepID=A0AAN6UGW0_9PEZI|nr:Spc7-domain-containing protein [Trichocladium antarcticum]
MASQDEVTLPATRRARKSIGSGPTTRKSSENATVDVGAMAAARRKSRSKSMGPAGLDALQSGNGNRRASLAVVAGPPPRSILKPTIPIVPEIPSFRPKQTSGGSGAGSEAAGTKVALRTEEEQQAAAREREERERAAIEKEIKDRREARRKSLANRRVSFAAEATLHTFHEIEEQQDSTTSTNSTRRASSVAAQSPAPQPQQHPDSDPPSTPPDYVQDHGAESPANQRDLHQRKRRRSSGAASMYSDEDTIASSVYDSDFEHADSVAEIQGEEMTGSSDSDEDGTVVTIEAEEMTSASVASARSPFSPDSTGSLDENLRLAARMAVTQRAEDEEEEVIAGFAGWGRKNPPPENAIPAIAEESQPLDNGADAEDQGGDMEMDMEADMDMDMTNAMGGILYPQLPSPDRDGEVDEDMSMDVTTALGGILSKAKAFLRRKSANFMAEAAEAGSDEFGGRTMEFTTAVGSIQYDRVFDDDQTDIDMDGNEDMSMEFTAVMGSLMSGGFPKSGPQSDLQQTAVGEDAVGDEDDMMDMTMPVGRILSVEVEDEEDADQTMGMDMTMPMGGIIKPASTPEARSAARKLMEQEADEPVPPTTAPERTPSPKRPGPGTTDGKPSPGYSAFQGNGLRRSLHHPVSPVAKRTPLQASSSPTRRPPSPKRNATQAEQSPKRTPPSPIRSASSSPMRNISPPKTTPRSVLEARLFHQDPSTGMSTPRIVLTPQGRRLSGLGADRSGLGSPRVVEIFDRRASIGEAATDFVPSQPANARRTVAFADPRVMEAEIDREREDEQDKEDGRRILEREVNGSQDDREVALNLREMIQGLSPKKSIFRGRKSLHVGSARGLLGKRPAELDDDEESEDQDGVKRLKGHQGSPVKNIRLQSPPSKAETTTGRKTRPSIRPTESANATPSVASSPQRATTPRSQGRFRDVDDQPNNTMDFEHAPPLNDAEVLQGDDGERMHLQDFLNMTSIRFMELTTTKRRHTIVPSAGRDSTAADDKDDVSLEGCVVAGACTVPMLELYQHSCRELKKYISEGRRIVREIESETFEENPPLFREYMTAPPEFRVLMDNQFKNVKTHARLLSKAMWYEWRTKLQDGLREGLLKTAEGMDDDDRLLARQQELLSSALPDMVKRLEALEVEQENLEAAAHELADCDPKDLEDARAELAVVDDGIAEKSKTVAELGRELDESVGDIEALTAQKQQCLAEIREADKIREECRGWSSTEISKLKGKRTPT